MSYRAPRFITDAELCKAFGLTTEMLVKIRHKEPSFPERDRLIKKTDSRAMDHFFDMRTGTIPIAGRIRDPEPF